jgi:hypothetical protein
MVIVPIGSFDGGSIKVKLDGRHEARADVYTATTVSC